MSNGTDVPNSPGLPEPTRVRIEDPIITRLAATTPVSGPVRSLWVAIKSRSAALDFTNYQNFIERVLCQGNVRPTDATGNGGPCAKDHVNRIETVLANRRTPLPAPLHGVDAYELLKVATEAFLLMECGVFIEELFDGEVPTGTAAGLEEARLGEAVSLTEIRTELESYLESHLGVKILPFLKRIVDGALRDEALVNSPYCVGIQKSSLTCPCMIELIWSYWHEENMLVQTLNAISLRFQNRLRNRAADPLRHLELDPLRPLNNLLWGFIQDEHHRLTLARRAYEYDHHYGITLLGKAAPLLMPADSRSKFLESFHTLLNRCSVFYKEQANTMIIPDGFPLLNALKETNLLMAEGMHNQYGDLPWTARVEMLVMQWLLARPEIRDFLRGRPMVPHAEGWMAQVDAMKSLQGWVDTSATHYRNLASFGEQVLLSVRFGEWNDEVSDEVAKGWATYWKPEIQGYIHSYRAVTGVDLTVAPVNATMPATLLQNRQGRMAVK